MQLRIQERMIKALLCDMDGTLVQSNWLHAEAWCKAFEEIGIDLESKRFGDRSAKAAMS